jgi:hypothetical protein
MPHELMQLGHFYLQPSVPRLHACRPLSPSATLCALRISLHVQTLMETFARYGPLASVKIMWPRKEEDDGTKTHNSGFVGFMVCYLAAICWNRTFSCICKEFQYGVGALKDEALIWCLEARCTAATVAAVLTCGTRGNCNRQGSPLLS